MDAGWRGALVRTGAAPGVRPTKLGSCWRVGDTVAVTCATFAQGKAF